MPARQPCNLPEYLLGKLIPLAYGLKKLQIICVIEDEKVSVDDLIDTIVDDISSHVSSASNNFFLGKYVL